MPAWVLPVIAGAQFLISVAQTAHATASASEEQRRRQELADAEAALIEGQATQLLEEAGIAAQDYRAEGTRVFGRQALAFARSGVRYAGSPEVRLQATRDRIAEGSRRILARGERAAEQLYSRARLTREFGDIGGVDPGAVAISHLPSLLQSGLNFAGELDRVGAFGSAAPTGTGGVTPAARAAPRTHYQRYIDIS